MEGFVASGNDPGVHLLREYLDDRGQAVSMERELMVRDAVACGIESRRARAALRPCTLLALGCVALGLLCTLIIFGLAIYLERFMPFIPAGLLAILAVGPFAAIAWRRIEPSARSRHCRGWTSLGLCPACAYRIAEIEPQEDGCRVCPECGSAWKMDEDTSPPASRPSRPSR